MQGIERLLRAVIAVAGSGADAIEVVAQAAQEFAVALTAVGQLAHGVAGHVPGRGDGGILAGGEMRAKAAEVGLDFIEGRAGHGILEVGGNAGDLGFQLGDLLGRGIGLRDFFDPAGERADLVLEVVDANRFATGDIAADRGDLALDLVEDGGLRRRRVHAVEPGDQYLQAIMESVDHLGRSGEIENALDAGGHLAKPAFEALDGGVVDTARLDVAGVDRRANFFQ